MVQCQGAVAPSKFLWRWLVGVCGALLLAHAALAAGTPGQWRSPAQSASLGIGSDLLTDDDRAYLAALPEIRVAVEKGAAAPYESVAANGEVGGYQADMLVSLASVFKLKVRPVLYDDWPSVLAAVRERQADMVLTTTVTSERLAYLAFTLGTVPVPAAVFGRAGVAEPVPMASATFALEREFASNDAVRRRFPQATIVASQTRSEALRAVLQRRADYYAGSILETTDTLGREGLQGLALRSPLPVGSGFYHFGVRKDWARLVTILNRGISTLRQAGASEVDRALARVPGAAEPVEPLALAPEAARWLAQTSVLRAGAVRGLALLNDVDAQGVHSGVAADYLAHVVQQLGVGVEVVPFDNVAQMLTALREQRIHLVPFLTKTEPREREFRYSAPYLSIPYVLVARTDAPAYWDLGSLRGRRLALAAEHPLRPALVARYPEILIVDADNGSQAMAMVASGQADAAVEVKIFANLRVNEGGGGELRTLAEVADVPAGFHFALAPGAAPLLPTIDRVLASMAPAESERLLRRWVAVDVVPGFPWRRWAPAIAVAAAALLALWAATLWWTRRLALESTQRQRALELVDDIGRTLPGCTFRYVLDDALRVTRTYLSSGSESFLGVKIAPGQTLSEVCLPHVDAELRPTLARELREATATRDHYEQTFPYKHPDGRRLWLYTEARRGTTPGGQLSWTGYVIDATQRHLMQQHIERESDERYLLLATASHELRAPAHTLLLALQTLFEDSASAGPRGTLGIARDAARTLVQLLDDVLDMARTRYGRIELRPQNFNLHALFEQAADSQAGLIAEKGLRFARHIAPGVPRTVRADPLRLKQVLVNVLNNAAKYTERGSIELSLRLAPAAGGSAAPLLFVVEDSGVGISAEMRERLFRPFSASAGGHLRADLRSTGLGLAHCQRLLGLMQGALVIDSAPGRGTQVSISLPLPPLAAARTPLRTAGAILVCDDDAVSSLLLAEMLRGNGHEVALTDSVDGALARWRQGDIRVVISDMNMPGVGGEALLRTLRAEEAQASAHTALIVCSGDPAPPQGATPPLFDAFISKPVDMRTLADTLAAFGVARRASQATAER